MKKLYFKGITIFAVLYFANISIVQANASACREIQWQPYQVYSVKSSLHQRTHIILPEPIQGFLFQAILSYGMSMVRIFIYLLSLKTLETMRGESPHY